MRVTHEYMVTDKVELEDRVTKVDLLLIIVSAVCLAWAFGLI